MTPIPSLITSIAISIALLGTYTATASETSASETSDAAVIAFAGIKPGDIVAEFLPEAHFTEVLCNAVGEAGRVYAVSVPQANAPQVAPTRCTNVIAIELKLQRHAAPESWSASEDPGVVYEYWSFTQPAENFATPEPLDVIFTQHYHDLHDKALGPANAQLVGTAWLQALKSNGVLIIAESSRRVKPQQIEQAMLAAGFIRAGESNVLYQRDHFTIRFRKP